MSSIRLRQPHTASLQGISTIGQLVLRDIPSSQSSPGQMSSFAKNFIDFLQLRSYNIWNNETTSCAYKVGSLWVPVLPSYLVTMVQWFSTGFCFSPMASLKTSYCDLLYTNVCHFWFNKTLISDMMLSKWNPPRKMIFLI